MEDWTPLNWLDITIQFLLVIIALLAWRLPKQPKNDPSKELKTFEPYQDKDSPAIYATSGIPSLAQLTEGMNLDPKKSLTARRLYAIGLAQFNHYVNNRDGEIAALRDQMANSAYSLGDAEKNDAEEIGVSLATTEDGELLEFRQAQYRELSPQARIYAQYKRQEIDALMSIARDLETNTPRTDYTSVKARIASGTVGLDSILSELPIAWQDIRTLNEKTQRPKVTGRPPKREWLLVSFMTPDKGLLEKVRAERDGDWIVSEKHNFIYPYEDAVPFIEPKQEGSPPVWDGKIKSLVNLPSSEWFTEFWRRGGRWDEEYRRARDGTSPKQLRKAYRRRLILRTVWAVVVVEYILLAAWFALQWSGGVA